MSDFNDFGNGAAYCKPLFAASGTDDNRALNTLVMGRIDWEITELKQALEQVTGVMGSRPSSEANDPLRPVLDGLSVALGRLRVKRREWETVS